MDMIKERSVAELVASTVDLTAASKAVQRDIQRAGLTAESWAA